MGATTVAEALKSWAEAYPEAADALGDALGCMGRLAQAHSCALDDGALRGIERQLRTLSRLLAYDMGMRHAAHDQPVTEFAAGALHIAEDSLPLDTPLPKGA